MAHVEAHWREFDGWAVAQGLGDPLKLPVARFCHLVWFWMTRDADPNDVRKLEAQLWQPPPGAEPKGPWSPEAEMAAFESLRMTLGK